MYLKRIELKGFKSFPNKTTIEFKNGITSVVGPNGSGKSNISDAIRWVLGEQSIKSLRGEKLEDVIFGGTQQKKPMAYCEVSLTIDNQDGIIDIDFSEVTIKRRAYKSGESQFYINSEQCRLKDIKELFLDTGIGKEGYSIIEQGKIDEILATNAYSRRRIFDEASGISKYRYKKEESQKKLNKTSENLERINDIFSEIEKQAGPLERQMKKALRFKDLSEHLKTLEINSFIRQLERIDSKLAEHFESEKEMSHKIETMEKKKEQDSRRLEELKAKGLEYSQEIELLQSQEYGTREIIERKNSEIKILHEKESHMLSGILRIDAEKDEMDGALLQNSKVLQKTVTDIEACDERIGVLVQKKTLFEDEISKNNRTIENAESEIETLRDGIVGIVDEKNKELLKLSAVEATLKGCCDRKKAIGVEVEELMAARNTRQDDICKIESETAKTDEKIKEAVKAKNHVDSEIETIECEISALVNKINSINLDMKENVSKLNIYKSMERQMEGLQRGVREVLKSGIHGIMDVVANVIKVEGRYETAIEVALGGAIQNIIASDEYAAKAAIEYLKKNNCGRATFLPLNVFDSKEFKRPFIEECGGVIGIASDIVSCDGKYKSIKESLLGRVIVVEDMDCAIQTGRSTGHRYKIVTLDGQMLNPGGSLTGGMVKKQSDGILSRGRIIDELSQKRQAMENDLDLSRKKESELRIALSKAVQKQQDMQRAIDEYEKFLIQLQNRAAVIGEALEEIDRKSLRLQSEKSGIDESVQNASNEIEKTNARIAMLEEKIKQSQERLKELSFSSKDSAAGQKETENALNAALLELARIESQRAGFAKEKERIEAEIERCAGIAANCETENGQLKKELEGIRKSIVRLKEEIKLKKEDLDIMDAKLADGKARKGKIESEIADIEDAVGVHESEYVRNREEKLQLQGKIQSLVTKKEDIAEKMSELYSCSYEDAMQLKDESVQAGQEEIKKIKSELKDIGSVNMDSIEEYKIVKERYDFYKEQKLDLENSINGLSSIIKNLESSMKREFNEKFNIIEKRFEEVFAELFGGGSASLRLTEPDDILQSDIEIIAKPPGKSIKNISLMSGGEKALTAIAVIFAILLTRPTPFCILDEIEAALDDYNIYRFGSFLKRLSDKTQFIAITHRMGTMEASDYIYGVTMEESGISKLLTLKLEEVEQFSREEKIG